MKIDRLITIIMMLLNKKKVTAKELADYFGVSVRTIQRDIDNLSLAGIPIYADVGKNGGYQLVEDYRFDKNFLNQGEAKILLSFLKSLETAVPYKEMKSVSNKMQSMLPEQDNEEKIVMNINPLTTFKRYREITEMVTNAIEERQVLTIDYINAELYRSTRNICPYTMVLLGDTWYMYAHYEDTDKFRMFKVSRIQDCHMTGRSYDPIPMPEVKPWESLMASDRPTEKLVLEIDDCMKGRLPEYFDPSTSHMEGDKIIVEVNFPVDEWLYLTVTGLVPYVKVREPEWFRDELYKRLSEGLEKLKG